MVSGVHGGALCSPLDSPAYVGRAPGAEAPRRAGALANSDLTVTCSCLRRGDQAAGGEIYPITAPEMAMPQSRSRSEAPNWLPGQDSNLQPSG